MLNRNCLKWDETSFTKGTQVSRTTPNLTWDLRGHNFVYKEHGSSKGVHDQPCESTGLTERHARITKTQQIGHSKGKRQTHLILSLMIYLPYQKPAFMVIVELDRKQNGKENRNMDFMYM